MTSRGRHLSLASFNEYLRSGVRIEHPIEGQPQLTLTIDPESPSVALRGPRRPSESLPRIALENVRVIPSHSSNGPCLQVRVTDPRLFDDAYPVLCAIADRIQLQGLSFSAATTETLRHLGRLLQRGQALPRDRELGLCGELLLLIGLSRLAGAETALDSWRGPHAEEHDFGIEGLDVEVKTTPSERREHWVDSLTQLQGTADRQLWLVSHQLTEAASGDGWRLPDLVNAAREEITPAGLRHELDRRLMTVGWADPLAETCRTRWRRRFPSVAYPVSGQFPRLTRDLLAAHGLSHALLTDVRYRVDLTDHPMSAQVPAIVARAITAEVSR